MHRDDSHGQPWQQAGRQTGTFTVQQVSGLVGVSTVSYVGSGQQPQSCLCLWACLWRYLMQGFVGHTVSAPQPGSKPHEGSNAPQLGSAAQAGAKAEQPGSIAASQAAA